jgi:acetyl esterase/lipase
MRLEIATGATCVNDTITTANRPSDPRSNWTALSQAERDAAYDNNAAVKNSASLIAERNQSSEALRASRKSFLDVPYGDRERTKIDLYPAAEKTAPCLIFLHGGYWQRNSREVFAMLVEGVAAHGWSVAIPGYSLAPDSIPWKRWLSRIRPSMNDRRVASYACMSLSWRYTR